MNKKLDQLISSIKGNQTEQDTSRKQERNPYEQKVNFEEALKGIYNKPPINHFNQKESTNKKSTEENSYDENKILRMINNPTIYLLEDLNKYIKKEYEKIRLLLQQKKDIDDKISESKLIIKYIFYNLINKSESEKKTQDSLNKEKMTFPEEIINKVLRELQNIIKTSGDIRIAKNKININQQDDFDEDGLHNIITYRMIPRREDKN